MKKSEITNFPKYFDYYINLNEDIELVEAFNKSIEQVDELDIQRMKKIGLNVYQENKWTVHKILQHITDWERIWCYRTLLFARQEGTIPVGLEEQTLAENCNADELPIEQLIAEIRAVRISTKAMFASFNQNILQINCKTQTYEMSVLAMGFNIIGHQIHHLNVIKERYYPLTL